MYIYISVSLLSVCLSVSLSLSLSLCLSLSLSVCLSPSLITPWKKSSLSIPRVVLQSHTMQGLTLLNAMASSFYGVN